MSANNVLFPGNSRAVKHMVPQLKICGITRTEDIEFCCQAGVDAVGFLIGEERLSGDGCVQGHRLSVARARALVASVPSEMSAVLLVHATAVEEVIAICDEIRPDAIQLQRREFCALRLKALQRALPATKIIKTIHVTSGAAFADIAEEVNSIVEGEAADAVLLDSGRRSINGTLQTGGTGLTHDWSISASIVRAHNGRLPIVLAGGLNVQNLRAAISEVRPQAVDIMTGSERAHGVKDYEAIRSLVQICRVG